ncbi:MAG: bifunctional pyr operon transcriptional regulator/uracil phosphoribosyltransferase PyrR [Deltaproteobacteria bacterium]|nr:bifunctional pyr operon transcriptional regulator/uracil phosphoribosyltransferase PyrR [Candidatus Anaeroferrophillus wilburensis]MBN2889888.1 bifunctional pyr operon transcriptional regulator/uracil phosphoribosyltransferase PyrR [Deltaproteobacteria bacterium]
MTHDTFVLDDRGMAMVLSRMAYEVLERNPRQHDLVLVGIRTRGVYLAQRLQALFVRIADLDVPLGVLDITLYRDDLSRGIHHPVLEKTDIPFSLDDKVVILVDDVLYTGRTVRAAMDGLMDFGRPQAIQLLVLVDRGLRELPIMPNFVGKHVPSSPADLVKVRMQEGDGYDSVTVSVDSRQLKG